MQLICACGFAFEYAKSRFSHDVTHTLVKDCQFGVSPVNYSDSDMSLFGKESLDKGSNLFIISR